VVTRLPALLLGVLVLVAPATSAGSSFICLPPPSVALPEYGAEDVPTNARLWFDGQISYGDQQSELVLIGPDGMEVETTEARIEMLEPQELVVLTPVEPLLPEARYQFWECDGPECTTLVSELTTGAAADDSPPALPIEVDREQGRGWANLWIDFEGVLVVSLGDVALDPATLTGSAHFAWGDATVPLSFGDVDRYCFDGWPEATSDEQTVPLRYGAFDLAGNFSGWSEPEPLSLAGCGCSANHGTSPLALLVLLLGLTRRRAGNPMCWWYARRRGGVRAGSARAPTAATCGRPRVRPRRALDPGGRASARALQPSARRARRGA
jgi:hypothetical protein